jgi:PleD family two-component response regulator
MNENIHRVLIVDDNRINRLKIIRALNKEGYELFEASGGHEALEMLQSRDFHLVLLDILMPDVDGFQVLEQMQSDQKLKKIPVIMVSAVEEQEDVDRCLEMGAVDYISKPFDKEVLKDRVRTNLENGFSDGANHA